MIQKITNSAILKKPNLKQIEQISLYELFSLKYYTLSFGESRNIETGLLFNEGGFLAEFQISVDLYQKGLRIAQNMFEVLEGQEIFVPVMNINPVPNLLAINDFVFNKHKIEIPVKAKIGQMIIFA